MKMLYGVGAVLAVAALAPANAAVTVHTNSFITNVGSYNGFEGLGPASYPGNTPYTEDGITVEYVGSASITTTSQMMEGNYSWYPNGGGAGYTKVTFGPTNAVQFALGSGWLDGLPALQYQVLSAGNVIASGEFAGVSKYTGFSYFGFSGMPMDELRLQVQSSAGNMFSPFAYEAGTYDAFTTGAVVPEPASWALMIAGFGLVGAAMRRRVAIAAAA
jgi:hypothetical protein